MYSINFINEIYITKLISFVIILRRKSRNETLNVHGINTRT